MPGSSRPHRSAVVLAILPRPLCSPPAPLLAAPARECMATGSSFPQHLSCDTLKPPSIPTGLSMVTSTSPLQAYPSTWLLSSALQRRTQKRLEERLYLRNIPKTGLLGAIPCLRLLLPFPGGGSPAVPRQPRRAERPTKPLSAVPAHAPPSLSLLLENQTDCFSTAKNHVDWHEPPGGALHVFRFPMAGPYCG